MVKLIYPPPKKFDPVFYILKKDTIIIRAFNPDDPNYLGNPLAFRFYGPLKRFDHQRGKSDNPDDPCHDPQRGILYAGETLSCCIVECFGDSPHLIICGNWELAKIKLTCDLKLLSLDGSGAMKAGTCAAIEKIPNLSLTQAWARFFYDKVLDVGGLIYSNAHNNQISFALNERTCSALSLVDTIRLDDPGLRRALLLIAHQNGLTLDP